MRKLIFPLAFLTACTSVSRVEQLGTAEEAVLSSAAATQDTQVREDKPASNFGVSQTAGTSGTAGLRKTLLTSFDTSAIPAHAGINSAVLTLTYFNAPTGAGTLETHLVTGAWNEMTATWGTAPGYDSTVAGTAAVASTTTVDIDVTSIVAAWANGAPNNGIAITETGGSAVFWTHEAAAGLRPSLSINWTTPASCTDGIANGGETDIDCGGTGTCGRCVNGKHCVAATDCGSGYCSAGTCATPPASCTDGIANGTETDVDCGGTCSADCANGKHCNTGADCQSGYCGNGTCATPTCIDGAKNGAETDVDCGGPTCNKCEDNLQCATGSDCASLSCVNGHCAAPTCGDGVKNGSETDVDCGGPACADCADGKQCFDGADCTSSSCIGGLCLAATCNDGVKNGVETDVDCGGTCALKCATSQTCGAASDCASSSCVSGLCAAPNCNDGVRNGVETDVDCGGSCAFKCATNQQCAAASDCASSSCVAGLCAAATCTDGVFNGVEADIDCGGLCAAKCATNRHCNTGADCASSSCVGNLCAAATCTDGVFNGTEADVDCGGTCALKCATNKQCFDAADCVSSSCVNGLCAAATCNDGVFNGTETDTDCGGSCAAKCANNKHCSVGADCTSNSCVNNVCVAPACNDGVFNGGETDTDCGGPTCAKCTTSQHCATASDCASLSCVGGLCAAATCSDGVKNGVETDTDCGGSCALKCATGKQCSVGADCASLSCVGGLCAAATCNDGVKNGGETDTDCGGPTCSDCANGKLCATAGDCSSGVCTGGTCSAPTCSDAVFNGSETDVDCGGTCALKCSNGKHCSANADCSSAFCNAGLCATQSTASCTDGLKNGSETDVDCGGSCALKCADSKQCSINADCASGLCYSGACYAQGINGAVVTSCTLPTIQSGYGESVKTYKPAIAKTGWGVLTTPPVGVTVKGAALVIHGGRWLDASTGPGTGASPWPYDDNDTVRKLAKLGYVVFDPAYRSTATAKHPAQAADVLCAARYLRDTMATSYPTVPAGMFVLGASAGAHLSALIAHAPTSAIDDGACPRTGPVSWRGVIAWSGVYDLTSTAITKASSVQAITDLLGYTAVSNPAGALAASPWSYVNPIGPDLLLSHGATDATLPASGTAAFHTRALSMGADSTNVVITGSFGIVHAGNLFDSTRPSQGCTALQFLSTH